jgi:hypothetical protein
MQTSERSFILEKTRTFNNNINSNNEIFKMSVELENSIGMFYYGLAVEKEFNGKTNLSEAMKCYIISTDLRNSIIMFYY